MGQLPPPVFSFATGLAMLVGFLGCEDGGEEKLSLPPAALPAALRFDPGSVVAQVGDEQVHLHDVARLARLAGELREEIGIDAPEGPTFEQQLGLALELEVLWLEASRRYPLNLPRLREQHQRLLARAYLDRFVGELDRQPVSEQMLQELYQQEMARYFRTGESDLYRPARLDAVSIVVGFFPDLHKPEKNEIPILAKREAEELSLRIYQECQDRVVNLDRFLALGRHFMSGHPTVRIVEFPKVYLEPGLAKLDPAIHRAMVSLGGNGAVASPVWTPGGVFVVRRGVTYPGKGERLEDIRKELLTLAGQRRKRSAFEERMRRLKSRYRARTWPDRLFGLDREGSPPK